MAASEPQPTAFVTSAIGQATPNLSTDAGLAFDTLKLASRHWVRDMNSIWSDANKPLLERTGYALVASGWRVTEVGFAFTGYALQKIGLL